MVHHVESFVGGGGERKSCECGASLVQRGFAMEDHRATQKHKLLLELKESDLESWKLALDEKTQMVECACGQRVYRWTLGRHQQSKTHLKKMEKPAVCR